MIPVKQTRLHNEPEGSIGNCWEACIASILELPIEDIPDCADENWWTATQNWLLKNCGAKLLRINNTGEKTILPGPFTYYILSGKSPRSDVQHAVVAHRGGIVHDPHPSDDGLDGEWREAYFFVPVDPSTLKRK